MGAEGSKNEAYEESLALFSQTERTQISGIYSWLSGDSKTGISLSSFTDYVKSRVTNRLGGRLHRYLLSLSPHTPSGVSHEALVVGLARMLKGMLEQKTELVGSLCVNGQETPVTRHHLSQLITDLLESYLLNMKTNAAFSGWTLSSDDRTETFCQHLLSDLRIDSDEESSPNINDLHLSSDDLHLWLSRSALCLHILDFVLHATFPVTFVDGYSQVPALIPQCKRDDLPVTSALLTFPDLLLLTQSLPSHLQSPWQLLFSSSSHGESFAMMSKRIMNKGACVILIRDTDGHLFGGFVCQSLVHSGQFTAEWGKAQHLDDTLLCLCGNSSCFLFSLHPTMNIYTDTGYNQNYFYFNHGQETLPNGLGLGGQLGYCGLWLDSEFGLGQSCAEPRCTTYGSPVLSAQPQFKVDVLEVWQVGPDSSRLDDSQGDGDKTTSILDKDPEAKAMLSLIDRGPISDGLRESDPTASSPEQHSLPPLGT